MDSEPSGGLKRKVWIRTKRRFTKLTAPEKKRKAVCIAKGCDSVGCDNPELMFHDLPKYRTKKIDIINEFGELTVWEKWDFWLSEAQHGKWPDVPLMWKTFCSRHFRESDYNLTPNGKKLLKCSAIPSINLSNEPTKHKERNCDDIKNLSGANYSKPSNHFEVEHEGEISDPLKYILEEKKIKRMMGMGCYAKNCIFWQFGENYYKLPKQHAQRFKMFDESGIHYYMDRRELWLSKLQIMDCLDASLCSKHFREDDFYWSSGQVCLKKTAVPSCNLEISQNDINNSDIIKELKSEVDVDEIKHEILFEAEDIKVLLEYDPKRSNSRCDEDINSAGQEKYDTNNSELEKFDPEHQKIKIEDEVVSIKLEVDFSSVGEDV